MIGGATRDKTGNGRCRDPGVFDRRTARAGKKSAAGTQAQRPRLYERDAWLDELSSAFAGSSPLSGAVMIEGGPGLGKTALLKAACHLAHTATIEVRQARCSELEASRPFGVMRQLILPVVDQLDQGLQLPEIGTALPPSDLIDLFDHVHTLLVKSTAGRPLVLAVDDLQWCDSESAGALHYLARRLPTDRLWFVGSVGTGVAGQAHGAIDRIIEDPWTRAFSLRPLRPGSVADLTREFFIDADEELVQRCYTSSGGNPFLLFALLLALEERDGNGHGRSRPSADCIESLAPARVLRSVRRRVSRLPAGAHDLLRAIAVVEGQDIRVTARLAGIDNGVAHQAAQALAEANLLRSDRAPRFLHPLERSTVYEELSPARRAHLHAAAARLLDANGASANEVALHLLKAEPAGDDWAVQKLHEAARQSLDTGSVESALSCLSRALMEPPGSGLRAQVLLQLASVEAGLGKSTALSHLREALDLGIDPVAVADTAIRLADIPPDQPRAAEDARWFEQFAVGLQPERGDLRLRLLVASAVMSQSPTASHNATETLESVLAGRFTGETAPHRLARAHIAFARLCEPGRATATEVADLAEGALQRDLLLDASPISVRVAARALVGLASAGRFQVADRLARIAQHAALKAGRDVAVAEFSLALARSLFVQGDLAAAGNETERALATTEGLPWMSRPMAIGLDAEILDEQGRTAEAVEMLFKLECSNPQSSAFLPVQVQRGRFRLREGRVAEALNELRLAGQRAEAWKMDNPAVTSLRATTCAALQAAGDRERARQLAAENLELARQFDAPWVVGSALRVAAALCEPADRLSLLIDAVQVLEHSGAGLEFARAAIELGATVRQTGQYKDARRVLRRGADIAFRFGARNLTEKGAQELRAAGAKPRRLALTGIDSLTSRERRVAELAAMGSSNSQIAKTLFVTESTIEAHLVRIYKKLGVRSRRELQPATGPAAEAQ